MRRAALAGEVTARFGAFLTSRVSPGAAERDRAATPFDPALIREAASAGLLGFAAPTSLGGAGRSAADWALALERVAYLADDLAFPVLLCVSVHVAEAIAATGDAALVSRYGAPLVRGERTTAIALHEDDAEPLALSTTVRRDGDAWVIEGEKSMITGGMLADPFVVLAREVESDDVLALLVEPGDEGASRAPMRTTGARSCGFARLTLDRVRVGDDRLLCASDGLGWAARFFAKRRTEEAAIVVGGMQAIFEACVASLRDRARDGRGMLDLPNIQERVGAMWAGLESSRAVLDRAVAEAEAGGEGAGMLGALAKHHATERALEMALAVVRVQGARGYAQEQRWERWMRDVLAMISAAGHQDTLLRAMAEGAVMEIERQSLFARRSR